MKGLFTAVALLFFFSSCKESGVQLSKSPTFVRYFSDGFQDQAIDMIQTSDNGFLMVAHAVDSKGRGWINLIKTDLAGNTLWENSIKSSVTNRNLQPSNLVPVKDKSGNDTGYLLVGTLQSPNFGTLLYVARINKDNGSVSTSATYNTKLGDSTSFQNHVKYPFATYVFGKGIAQLNDSANFFVVGQLVQYDLVSPAVNKVTGNIEDMFFAKINGTTLDTIFTKTYGAGTSKLANRLFLDFTQTNVFWGGTRLDQYGTHMRLVKSGLNNSKIVGFDNPYPLGDLSYSIQGNDLCPYGYDFVVVGNDVSEKQIVLTTIGNGGNEIRPLIRLPLNNSKIIKIDGNSVCSTLDGGLLLLGTNTVDAQGTNTDYYLTKLDAAGTVSWEKTQGGKYPDAGVKVLQSSDGGYVVLGTTTLANVKTVFLMKTDSQGNIE